jgi:hypothetical protein
MSLVVFSGPTIPPEVVASELDGRATCRGPAGRGDVYRAQEEGARAILIIDGYFEHRLTVWHKEILWALFRGVRVYGASSLGALRAVELEPFGMRGVGRVFEWFRNGDLEDDDEVAVVHAPPEQGYKARSEAMVNIRATLAEAARRGRLSTAMVDTLVAAAKSRFYPERTLPGLLAAARGLGAEVEATLTDAMQGEARIDQKRLDALEAIRLVRQDGWSAPADAEGLPERARPRPSFHFEYTEAWHEALQGMRGDRRPPDR